MRGFRAAFALLSSAVLMTVLTGVRAQAASTEQPASIVPVFRLDGVLTEAPVGARLGKAANDPAGNQRRSSQQAQHALG